MKFARDIDLISCTINVLGNMKRETNLTGIDLQLQSQPITMVTKQHYDFRIPVKHIPKPKGIKIPRNLRELK